jgi:integrase
MAGQLRKKGKNKWLLRVFDSRDSNGRRHYIYETFHGGKKAADKRLIEIANSKNQGTYVKPSKGTLREYLDQWLETSGLRVSPKTLEGYKWQLEQIPDSLGNRRLSGIRDNDIQRFYNDLTQKREFSPKTVRHIHAALRAALQKATITRLIPFNPCDTADLPRLEHREMQSLSVEEAQKLRAAAKNDRLGTLFIFNLITGCRPGETFALKWSDFDFEARTVQIQRTLHWQSKKQGGGYYFDKPKTKKSRRSLQLPAGLVEDLKRHRANQSEALLKLGVRSELAFTSETGGPLHWQNVIKRHFKKAMKEAGLPADFRFYSLRHTSATQDLKDGVNPKIVSARLGHNSVAFTLDTYVDYQFDMQNEAAEHQQKRFYG